MADNNSNQFTRRKFLTKDWKELISNSHNGSGLTTGNHLFSDSFLKTLPAVEPEVLFLNRSSFGIRPADYARVKSIGIGEYLEEQLYYESIDNSELEDILSQAYPLLDYSLSELVAYIREGDELGMSRVTDAAVQLVSATMLRQLYSKHQLHEVMVEFWSNHFNVDLAKGFVLFLKTYEDKHIIRPLAMSSFRELLHADAKSASMMYYLDNYTNTKYGPNENYARELMELHTLGVDGGYSEQDVKEVARCFTGWSIGENENDFFEYYDNLHDEGEKQVLGHSINNSSGLQDGEQVLDILADNSVCAGFISEKLVRRFCSDVPGDRLVRTLGKTYMSTDGDIREMLRTIFHSNEFLDSVDKKFKRPVEFVTSVFRNLNSESQQYQLQHKFTPLYITNDMYSSADQVPFLWSPPTGYPDVASYWSNISSLLRRINLANGIAIGDIGYPGAGIIKYSNLVRYSLSDVIQDAETAEEIILMLENTILYREMSNEDRQILQQFLLMEGEDIPEDRIRAVIGILLSSAYFQLR